MFLNFPSENRKAISLYFSQGSPKKGSLHACAILCEKTLYHKWTREVVDALSLEILKVRLVWALKDLISLKMFLLIAGGLELAGLKIIQIIL